MTPDKAADILDRIRDEDAYTIEAFTALTMAMNTMKAMDNDCISRQAAVDMILSKPPEPYYPVYFAQALRETPPIFFTPYQKSDSMTKMTDIGSQVQCQKCGHTYPFFIGFERFCPHCGKKIQQMDKKH